MKRRDFLKNGGGIATTFAIASTLGAGFAQRVVAQAIADPGARVVDAFTYRGKKVQILQQNEVWTMTVNGAPLSPHYFVRRGDGPFASHALPFRDYSNARDLAKALLDAAAYQLIELK